jgi:uncharacterized membrane protein YphA (DoxX/SURF4 family)
MDTPISRPAPPAAWTTSRKIFFRFFCAFFLLYIFFNPNAGIPKWQGIFHFYIEPFHLLIPWIGQHILHLSKPITNFTAGSGDTTYDNLMLLLVFVLASLTALVWTILDRKKSSYNSLFYWLTTILRYYLAITLLTYGLVKVFKLQFPYPGLDRMLETYGDSSPMGLAWTFMGYSQGYNYFTGLAEVFAGSLLFFRRTTAIGAFIAFIVSVNISAMNFCFDIPVKLLSSMMAVIALYLLGDNIGQLFGLFFLRRAIGLSIPSPPVIRKKGVRIALLTIKTLLIAYVMIGYTISFADSVRKNGDHSPRTPLYGVYNTKLFIINKDTLQAMQTDTTRWKQLVIDNYGAFAYAMLKMMNDTLHRYGIQTDTIQKLVTISDYVDSTKRWRLHYSYPDKDNLVLLGSRLWGRTSDSIRIDMVRFPLNHFRLDSRGFNWVNEYPYNR